jgi:hypothetical protein
MSLLWPNVEDEAGRRSAVRRGFWAGLVITIIFAVGPPPMGAIAAATFLLVTAGIHWGQPWAARAGLLAAYAPLLWQLNSPYLPSAFVQCTIAAYFFFSAWRGLRARGGTRNPLASAAWLSLSLLFVAASWYLGTGVVPVAGEIVGTGLIAGDRVAIRPLTSPPRPGDVVAARDPKDPEKVALRSVQADIEPSPDILGAARWIVWSDAAGPADSPLAYYTKARWGRFPKRIE